MEPIIRHRLPHIEGDWHEFEVKKNTKRTRQPDSDDHPCTTSSSGSKK